MGRKPCRGLLPGSFDPPTCGHEELINQAAVLFDELLVGVAVNRDKAALLVPKARVALLERLTAPLTNVTIVAYEGLTARFARENDVSFLVRGLRNVHDLEYEKEAAYGNDVLGKGLKTVFLFSGTEHATLSSRLVREVIAHGGVRAAQRFIPASILEALEHCVNKRGG